MRIKGYIKDLLFVKSLKKINVKVCRGARVHTDSSFEGNSYVGSGTGVFRSSIGRATYFSRNCRIEGCKIGRFCSFGENVRIVVGQHPTSGYVSTHPFFYSDRFKDIGLYGEPVEGFKEHKYADEESDYVVIGNDVWVGSDVLLMEGVTIGDGAVIAAGAVVTKNIPPYAVAGGVPAKVIKYRFEPEEIEIIRESGWFEKDLVELRKARPYFVNTDAFSEYISDLK